ncbi:MAG: TetR/AcrR family transcriptional regulator [Bacilli bacterium]|jgi:AcrR family transcriptional regulator
MRILSEKLNKRIISESTKLFYDLGYEKTSMRTIAHKCRTSVGNLYRYYKKKEDIFLDVTKGVSEKLEEIITSFQNIKTTDLNDPHLLEALNQFFTLATKQRKVLVIYLEHYSRIEKDNLLTVFEEEVKKTIKHFVPSLNDVFVTLSYKFLLVGIIHVLRTEKEEDIKARLEELFQFLFTDMKGRIR